MMLVTSRVGFIRSCLVAWLVRDRTPIRVLDNFSTGQPEALATVRSAVDLVAWDLRDETVLALGIQGVDVVFHLAAESSVPRSIADPKTTVNANVSGTLALLLSVPPAGCRRLALASTCAIYGDGAVAPTSETALPGPLLPYAVSKLTAEHLCTVAANFRWLVTASLRYVHAFGPDQELNVSLCDRDPGLRGDAGRRCLVGGLRRRRADARFRLRR